MSRYTLAGIVMVVLFALIPTATSAAPTEQTGCEELKTSAQHHTLGLSKYWGLLKNSGTVKVFKNTGDVIVFVRVAECGGRYLIAFWRGGKWNTHFIATWAYVQGQIAGAAVSSWASVIVQRSFFIVAVPCPGSWTEFERPCSTGRNE